MRARITGIVDIEPIGPGPAPAPEPPPSPTPAPEPPSPPPPSPSPSGPRWVSALPDVAFPPDTYDLKQHTEDVTAQQHFEVATSALRQGVTLGADTGVLTRAPDAPASVAEGLSYRIVDNAPAPSPGPSPSPPTDAAADFARRCEGAFRVLTFKTPADLGGGYGAEMGHLTQGDNPAPVIDLAMAPSGNGSMRYDVLPILGGSMWWTNMAPDLALQFDGGDEFAAQFRYRISPEIAKYAAKIFLFGTGDTPGVFESSCSDLEIELNSQIFGHKYLMAYNACPGSCEANSVFIFDGEGMPGGHVYMRPEVWQACNLHVKLGPRETHNGHEWFANSNVKIWWQFGTEPESLVFDWTGGVTAGSQPSSSPACFGLCAGHDTGGNQRYGKLWLLPYNQELDAGAQAGKIWYADLILSRSKISEVRA